MVDVIQIAACIAANIMVSTSPCPNKAVDSTAFLVSAAAAGATAAIVKYYRF